MKTITNLTSRPFPLTSGHVVPASGTLDIDEGVYYGDDYGMINGHVLAGMLAIKDVPEVANEASSGPETASKTPKPSK